MINILNLITCKLKDSQKERRHTVRRPLFPILICTFMEQAKSANFYLTYLICVCGVIKISCTYSNKMCVITYLVCRGDHLFFEIIKLIFNINNISKNYEKITKLIIYSYIIQSKHMLIKV